MTMPVTDADDDLVTLVRTLWSGRWLIVGITTLAVLAGLAYALLATPHYQASVVLAPAEQPNNPSGALGPLGGLAGIAGIQVANDHAQQSIAVLRSLSFARDYIAERGLARVLVPGGADAPDVRDALREFDRNVRSVSDDKRTGLVTLTIEWTDPALAARWANEMVARLNDRLRARALQEHGRNVDYLRAQMATTQVVSLQQALGRLLESEMQQLLLARGNAEFAFRVIDPAMPPKYRSSPQRAVVVLGSALVGGILSCILVLVRSRLRGLAPAAAP